ncbi:MAG: aromatic amino acid lyase [Patescibacteria group bacterium]|nr:aromatic amino acid lyase [Patescibacteria group bacterium]
MKKKLKGDERVTLSNYVTIAQTSGTQVEFDDATYERVAANRGTLLELTKNRVVYGVNTGMGGFVDWLIPEHQLKPLQENLIKGVATNVGEPLSDSETRGAMLARIISLSRGNSAVSEENFRKLISIFNAGIIPYIPQKGSLGASGDLGPLACIALVGTGAWKAKYNGTFMPGAEALKKAGINPMVLDSKEGLAFVNGTSAMVSLASLLIERTERFVEFYELVSALTLETLRAKRKPFDPRVHALKPHKGQQTTAKHIFELLADSKLIEDEDIKSASLFHEKEDNPHAGTSSVEDAYSLRCTPQIIGPIRDTLIYIRQIAENELNSSNDNPLVITEEREVFHNGHFHGQYLAMAMDQLAVCLTTLSNLSDRRIDRFLDEHNSNGLPPFLSANPGIQFGLMGGQFMTASLTAENRSLCVPLSIQTLPSTGDFQDIVSLGLVAARRVKTIFENLKYITAFELMCAVQAAEFRGANKLGSQTSELYKSIRKIVPSYTKDRVMTDDLEQLAQYIESSRLQMP